MPTTKWGFILRVWASVGLLVGIVWLMQWALDEHAYRRQIEIEKRAQTAYAACQALLKANQDAHGFTSWTCQDTSLLEHAPDRICRIEMSGIYPWLDSVCVTGWHRK